MKNVKCKTGLHYQYYSQPTQGNKHDRENADEHLIVDDVKCHYPSKLVAMV